MFKISKEQILLFQKEFSFNLGCELPSDVISPQLQSFIKIQNKFFLSDMTPYDPNYPIIKSKNHKSKGSYSTVLGESFLSFLTPLYSKISQKRLVPTYSYFRQYQKDDILMPHIDRPACQYSATLQIEASEKTPWGISFYNPNNTDYKKRIIKAQGKLFNITFYKGIDTLHWREPLPYDWSNHLFLHWVDGDDPNYKPYHFDGRKSLGSPK